MGSMKIILAQGNPESRFNGTRHNLGFFLVDQLQNNWLEKPKFHALIAESLHDDEKVLWVKPTTFYNETGLTARTLVDFYKIDPVKDLLVIHDDLALPFGTLRIRSKGSDAGNNGIKSLTTRIGENYRRLRVGIWNEQRNIINDVDFVLGHFTLEEKEQLPQVVKAVEPLITQFLDGSLKDHSVTLTLA